MAKNQNTAAKVETETETKTEIVPAPSTATEQTVVAQKEEPKFVFDQKVADELIAKHGNKSKAIRAMSSEGKSRSEIAKILGIRYQHVNNVLKQPLKREIKAEREALKNGNGNGANEAAKQ